MRRLRIIESLPGCRTLLRLGVLVWLGLGASVGWGQPANDNFANAWTIVGASGTTNGSNVGATFETGEPDLFGLAAQESVWFTWTAPADGSYTFTTTGSDFDSLFGIYTGSAVNALTPVGQGYDVISASQSQPVTFTASAGTAYYVQVDGYALGIPDGNYVLNWNTNNGPSSAGDFLFASQATAPGTSMPMYIASERESNPPQDPRGKMHAAGEPSYGARLTITRLKGSTGRVLVDYVVTNGLYTNFFITNVFGTNMVATNTTAPNTFTNYFSTNIVVQERFENNEYGRWVYLDWYDITSIIGTNINGVMQVTKTNYSTNVPPAFACFNTPGPLPPPDTNGIIAYTNAFCIQTNITNIVASATPYADYTPTSGELTFDDFQMAQDIFVPVFASGNRSFPILNHVLIATITNVELDSLESTAIPPPTASTAATNAMLNILSTVAMVAPFQSNPETGPPGTGTGVAGTNVFNFERATLRCTETVNGTGVAYVGVTRSTVNASQGTTVNYRIDYYFPWTDENNTFMNANDWEIPLQPGSDYAGIVTRTPTGTYSDNIHFGDVSGTLSWGAYDTATKFIQIPITNESLVQFNEDLLVQLSLPGPTYPPADSDRSLGYVQTCNLTILFNDQPAGAHDNNYNPDNNDNTDPPYIQHPGPNSSVYAIALQPDGKAVIGGDFSSYNGIG
ncbi:MAG TPA: hypothetical protein VMU04_19375, partial [Candidatus Acidoferrum sp.]|nr:hypothetical protein [Candidatus Acidoferrum sp.]